MWDLHRITKIPGTRGSNKLKHRTDLNELVGFSPICSPNPHEKLRGFLSMRRRLTLRYRPKVVFAPRQVNPDRIFEAFHLDAVSKGQGKQPVSAFPMTSGPALSTLSWCWVTGNGPAFYQEDYRRVPGFFLLKEHDTYSSTKRGEGCSLGYARLSGRRVEVLL